MKVAVTYHNGTIFQHFGHSEQFKVYNTDNGKIVDSQVVDTNGQGHGALSEFLSKQGVQVLICGGIGAGAQNALAQAGIQVFGGVSGMADDAVHAYLAGNLKFNTDVHCSHHDHEHSEGHSCGEHKCGEDKHGCAGNHCH
jgi:predicted Fe-Mo cluster-binding NifX family protein